MWSSAAPVEVVGQVERLEAQLEGPPVGNCHQPRDGQIDVPHAGTRDAVADVIAKLAGGWFAERGAVQVQVERLRPVDVVADLIRRAGSPGRSVRCRGP